MAVMIILMLAVLFLFRGPADAARIKEISDFEGVRSNHLIGFGLVVGLEGKGDKSRTEFTVQALTNMLNRFGMKLDAGDIDVRNVAGVMVTAGITPMNRTGSKLDVTVSSIGDAKTLQGGTLLFTPLTGADGETYAVAQGPVTIGGSSSGSADTTLQQVNFQTVGRVSGGGLVEREIPLTYDTDLYLALKDPDFTTASKISAAINETFGGKVALPTNAAKINIIIPEKYKEDLVRFMALVEGLDVQIDTVSKVVINERTGTVVIGENVRVGSVAVAHGSLTVEINTKYEVSQPELFSRGVTTITPEVSVDVTEKGAALMELQGGTSLGELVSALNALGVSPRDLISILQAIKAAGALQAELTVI
ncbi:MAG: flagellar basal body P-ring protein FlgI [Thermodesulfobacteriota bacterium]